MFTVTVTRLVSSPMVDGCTVIVLPLSPARVRKFLANDVASAAVAPGTMTLRAASYAALSAAWRILFSRVISNNASKNVTSTGKANANSTAVTPRRTNKPCELRRPALRKGRRLSIEVFAVH